MTLSANSQYLVNELKSLPQLDGRFSNITLVNFDPLTGLKRGCFSLVFKAHDDIHDVDVALKFYDLDPRWSFDKYRIDAFQREHEILQSLLNVDRCLQLASDLKTYNLVVGGFTVACRYFAVAWVHDEIDTYFLGVSNQSPLEKLKLFNEIVLAIEALHKYSIFHRDIKADNLRAVDAIKRLIIAIDLGTAARIDSNAIGDLNYSTSVGAPAYAAPEALCGLSADRSIAPYTDVYAIGCLLFELFNPTLFYVATRSTNSSLDLRLAAMNQIVAKQKDDHARLKIFREQLGRLSQGIAPVSISAAGSSIPLGVASILDDLLSKMTEVDYRKRPARFEWVRMKIWIAIKVLENESADKKRIAQARQIRRLRDEKILAKQQRIARQVAIASC